jgi:APA family basic amino acid/polyamine antiporter
VSARLGTGDAVVIGLGAGIFASFAPAATAAVVAYCNATSSARLAARYPSSGCHCGELCT